MGLYLTFCKKRKQHKKLARNHHCKHSACEHRTNLQGTATLQLRMDADQFLFLIFQTGSNCPELEK